MKPFVGTLTRNLAWLAGGDVLMKGLLFAVGVLVARGLGPAAMGVFTVSYGAAIVFMLLLAAGQAEVVMREVARRRDAAWGIGRLAQGWQARVALAAVPAAVAGALLVPDGSLRWGLLAFVPYAWLRRSLITVGAAFKGLDRMDVEVAGRGVELAVAAALLVPLAAGHAPVWTTGLAFTAGGAAGLALVTRKFGRLPRREAPGVTRAYLAREGLSFLGLSMTAQVRMRLDTFLLAALGVAQAGIGKYGVGGAPVWGLLGVGQLVAVSAYPPLARAVARAALSRGRVVALGVGGLLLGSLLAAVVLLLKVPLVRFVFGAQYLEAVPLMAILAWTLPATCGEMVLGAVTAAAGRQAWALVQAGVLIVALAVSDLVVIPRWGLAGCAAVSVAVSFVGLLGIAGITLAAVGRPRLQESPVLAGFEAE